MENTGVGNSPWAYVAVTIVVIVVLQVVLYILDYLKNREPKKESIVKNDAPLNAAKEKTSGPPVAKQNKKKQSTNWKNKGAFSHPYLATNLMGHTSKILNMDCSSDGKYLVSCAEDEPPPDPGDSSGASSSGSGSEGGSEGAREDSPPGGSVPGSPQIARRPPRTKRRRQKPRPTRDLMTSTLAPILAPAPVLAAPLQRYAELKMADKELAGLLKFYLLSAEQLATLGYPVESTTHPQRALIYSVDFSSHARRFDVNAREFVPGKKSSSWSREEDSGRGSGSSGSSGSSSPRSGDSDPDSEEERAARSVERLCVRCRRNFLLTPAGEYLTREQCRHHWGRLAKANAPTDSPVWAWGCCGGPASAAGCVRASLHVWSGTCAGLNGPLEGFVRTKARAPRAGVARKRVLALDCEMCYTAAGLQAVRLEVVGADGRQVYGAFVLPDAPVVDYNTRFSGICARDLRKATKSLRDVQCDLLALVDADTILVGHGLENDLRALRVLHGRVVDTAVAFPHARGLPFRRSLRALAAQHLARPVQETRHCPLEDARASMELMLWRVQEDFRFHRGRTASD